MIRNKKMADMADVFKTNKQLLVILLSMALNSINYEQMKTSFFGKYPLSHNEGCILVFCFVFFFGWTIFCKCHHLRYDVWTCPIV